LWCFGPDTNGPNLVVDCTTAIQYLIEIKEHVNSGFQWATKEGPLGEEPMRGIRFNLQDVKLHADSIHRGAGQLMPCTRRVLYACLLTGKPTFQEPVFKAIITTPSDTMSGVFACLSARRGSVEDQEPKNETDVIVTAYIPIAESFGFQASLRQATGGQAFPVVTFDHWQEVPGPTAIEADSYANKKALEIRKRKGLKEEIPAFTDYYDKL